MSKKIRIIGPRIQYPEIYSGYTYFMKCKKTSIVKIGFSRNPTKRLLDLKLIGSNYSNYDFKILFVINENIERAAHNALRYSTPKTRETYIFNEITPLDFAKWLITPRGRWPDENKYDTEASNMRKKIKPIN